MCFAERRIIDLTSDGSPPAKRHSVNDEIVTSEELECPEGVDPSVFAMLPREIQLELL